MAENNIQYTLVDLLEDEDFIALAKHPDPANKARWNTRLEAGELTEQDFELATYCINSLYSPERHLSRKELADVWTNVQTGIAQKKRRTGKRSLIWKLTTAACLLLFAGSYTYISLMQSESLSGHYPDIEKVQYPTTMNDRIQIVLSNDNSIFLKETTAHIQYNDKGEAEVNAMQMISPLPGEGQAPSYNQVIVPKGKHTSIVFSDGSKIWLNVSSRVVYPLVFGPGKREIYLEGEAFIEVSQDPSRPFIVKTKQMNVKALGTSFNVTAYNEEPLQTVVLVTGKVAVQTKGAMPAETELLPNQQFSLNGSETSVQEVKVEDHITWKDGLYIYKEEKLSYILSRLEHYYGISIRYSSEIGDMKFSGKLDLKNDPERVLNGLSNTAPLHCREEENDTYHLYINQ
ncbi:MAG: FecR domain-containing protein [Tannerellaceae bacterium]|jgi:hypothetical protein|nr:FecR domain-containing protein [Tannerellaceae bacterium]